MVEGENAVEAVKEAPAVPAELFWLCAGICATTGALPRQDYKVMVYDYLLYHIVEPAKVEKILREARGELMRL